MSNNDQWMAADSKQPKPRTRLLEWFPVRRKRGSREQQIHEIFTNTPLFENMNRQDWNLLSNLFHERKYVKGEIIFEKGMPGLGMYVILEGDVKIVENSDEGGSVLAQLTTGDFFGEMAVIQKGTRNATAIAVSPCELIGIFRPQLRELLKDRPRLGKLIYERLARVMADRLRMADDLLYDSADSVDEAD